MVEISKKLRIGRVDVLGGVFWCFKVLFFLELNGSFNFWRVNLLIEILCCNFCIYDYLVVIVVSMMLGFSIGFIWVMSLNVFLVFIWCLGLFWVIVEVWLGWNLRRVFL